MDKQDAIDFVLDELDKGRSPAEITAALSRKLDAPVELVGKFVRQTKQRYEQSQGVSRQPLAGSQKPSASGPQPSAFSQQPLAGSQKPPAYSQPPAAHSQPPAAYSEQPLAGSLQPSSGGLMPADYRQPEAAAEALPDPNKAYEAAPVMEAAPVEQVEREAADALELEKYILDQLGKNKREGDIVLGVVERTGWDYKQAQRMVSRVGARNYKKVTARQNCLIIPLAVVFLIAGLILLGASVFEAYQIRIFLPSPDLSLEQVQAAVERGRNLPWAFITGLALSLGGGFGLISAIRKQME